MNCAVVVQTCDRYEPFWGGFFHFMKKQWSNSIPCPIYFCNETREVSLPDNFKQIRSKSGTFVENLNFILDQIKEDNIFYMLEDFWPTAPMRKSRFLSLFDCFLNNDADALQVSTVTPYYSLTKTDQIIYGQRLLQFASESDWIFNFQARFWKKEIMRKCLRNPIVSEKEISSAITVEMESDKFAKNMNLKVLFHHYFWYPISGVAYRGELTEIGKQMQNIVEIERYASVLHD